MTYVKTSWQDRVVEKPLTYTLQDNGDGTVTLVPVPGTVTQEGTPLNATNFNNLETQYEKATAASFPSDLYTSVSGADLNTYRTQGFFHLQDAINAPAVLTTENDTYLQVMNGGAGQDWTTHILYDVRFNRIFYRRSEVGVWQAWYELWHTENLPNPAQTTGFTMSGGIDMGNHSILNAFSIELANGTRITEDVGQRTAINAESDRFDVVKEDASDYIIRAIYDTGVFQFKNQDVWHAGNMVWDGNKLTIDGKAVGGVKSVQRGYTAVGENATVNVTITAVDMSKAFTPSNHSIAQFQNNLVVSVRLINSTTVAVTCSGLQDISVTVPWEVVESY